MSARILMTGSRSFTDAQIAEDALNAALVLVGAGESVRTITTASDTTAARPSPGTLVHGAAQGADMLLAAVAERLGMATEAHPARWNEHTETCPDWDRKNATCKLAGFRRNAEMIRSGVRLCLAFPTHPQALAPGQDRRNTSRGTWNCAEEASKAGIATFVVWGDSLFPFGGIAAELLSAQARLKRLELGPQGSLRTMDVYLPF